MREIRSKLQNSGEIESTIPGLGSIEERIKLLEKENNTMQERLEELEKENLSMKTKLKEVDLNENCFTQKIVDAQKSEEHLQRENIDSKDYCSESFEKKIQELEQADLYIQETTRLMSEKIVAFESMLQISSSNNDDTRQQMLDIQNGFQELKKTLQTASDNEDTNESEKVEKKELLASEDSKAKIKDSLPSPNMNSDVRLPIYFKLC